MSAALAAVLAQKRPAIGSRVSYTVKYRSGSKEHETTWIGEVTAHCGRCVVLTIPDYGAILVVPEWWQDGTCKEVADGR